MPNAPLLETINPASNTIPGISHAVVVKGGQLIFLSGHVPLTDTGQIAGPGLEEQVRTVFANIQSTLEAAQSSMENLVRITIYVRDFREEDLPIIRRVRDQFVNLDRPPASALIGVASLFHPEVRVEIDAIAVS
jgi:2-iminobutanoate/2-iminopropanoate deaminase